MTSDIFAANLAITSGAIINTAGFRIFVQGLMAMTADTVLQNLGSVGSNAAAGTKITNPGGAGAPAGTVGGGADGADGQIPVEVPSPGQPSLNVFYTPTQQSDTLYDGGDASGVITSTSTQGGGEGGAGVPNSNALNAEMIAAALWPIQWPSGTRPLELTGGAGGGAGFSSTNTVTAAGGGGGGGVIVISAGALVGSGTISVAGGNSGTNSTPSDASGGGGGGGLILIHTIEPFIASNFTFILSGGAPQNIVQSGGLPTNTSAAYGKPGQVIIV